MIRTVLLGDLISDIAMGPFGSNLKVDSFTNSGVPIIKGGNLYGFEVGGNFSYVSEEKAQSLKRSLAYPDDIVITHRGTLGQISIVPHDKYPYYLTSQSQLKLTVNEKKALPRYLLYYLRSPLGRHELMQHRSQVGVPSIATPTKAVKSFKVLLPNLREQAQIVETLGTIDEKIELNQKMNETLEQMGWTLFRHYLVDNPEAEKWEEVKIGELVNIKGGGTPSTKEPSFWSGNIAWTSPRDLTATNNIFLNQTAKMITEKGLARVSSGILPKNTLLLSSRAPIGYIAITSIPIAINQGYIAFLPDAPLSNYYMYFWLRQNMERIKGAANGSTFMEISKSAFRNITTKKPDAEMMTQFDAAVEPLFQQVKYNEEQVQTLIVLRDTLLPRLISGKLEVS